MTHILKAHVTNFMGVEDIQLELNGKSVTIGGKNGQGKSSLINAIKAALAGKKFLPPKPVREGATESTIDLELDSYDVSLRVLPDRTCRLAVKDKEGRKFSSPQKMLSDLFGAECFDPGEFLNLTDSRQRDRLLSLVDVDVSELEEAISNAFDNRRELKKELQRVEVEHAALPYHENFGFDEEISSEEVSEELTQTNDRIREISSQVAQYEQGIVELSDAQKEAQELRERLLYLDSFIESRQEDVEKVDLESLRSERGTLEQQIENFGQRLKDVTRINEKVRDNKIKEAHKVAVEEALDNVKRSEEALKSAREEKNRVINSLEFPLEGLSVDDNGVTYNGILLEQLSESEQWKVSIAMGLAINKGSVMLMSHSGGLDSDSRAEILKRAKECDCQLLLEVVDTPADVEIVIQNGEVV